MRIPLFARMVMPVYQEEVNVKTNGEGDILDITDLVGNVVTRSGIKNGVVHVFVLGSTAAVSTMEYEPGLKMDFLRALERVAPRGAEYEHHLKWGDNNGHSHVRAAIIGPSLSIPIRGGSPVLGTWQQIILAELDIGPRDRRIVVTVMGE